MDLFLCRGWRRTGKDSFYKDLISTEPKYCWLIYSNINKNPFNKNKYIKKISLADKLKIYTHEYLGLEDFNDASTYEDVKDKIPVNKLIKSKESKLNDIDSIELYKYLPKDPNATLRDWYIAFGKAYIELKENTYWCSESIKNISKDYNLFITDYRLKHEKKYFLNKYNIITIHLFRSEVQEPDINIQTEHDLNDEISDYLLVPSEEDFIKAVKRFPQYKNYKFIGIV